MAVLGSLVMAVATAGVIRHDVPLSLYRDLARQSDFMAVGRHTDSPESDDYAAGVLVAPGWVLTAAHFVGETSFWTFGEQQFRGVRVIRHPKLEPGATETQWTGWDMALVELAAAFRINCEILIPLLIFPNRILWAPNSGALRRTE